MESRESYSVPVLVVEAVPPPVVPLLPEVPLPAPSLLMVSMVSLVQL
ncbi:hypothetical protein ABZV34_35675 [Streptomyces sp. NPDC005195]